jgi:hypothetical protein
MLATGFRPGSAITALALLATMPLVASGRQGAPPAPQPAPATGTAAVALPSAREVIDRHIKAIGGRETVRAHSSSHATGSVSVPSAGLTGTLEVFAARPNKSLMRITLPGLGEVQEGFDGTIGWSISALTGPTLLEGKQLEQRKFDSDFDAELADTGRYQAMTVVGAVDFDGRQCYKLRLVRSGGGEDFQFYDVATGLKAGSTATRESPMGAVTGTTIESDYRRFGKLLQPTKLTQTIMGLQQVITLNSIEYDKVSPDVFELPAPIKALMK